MAIRISETIRDRIHAHLEAAYPEEGAGFLLGDAGSEPRLVADILTVVNSREDEARRNRYLITPESMLAADLEAEKRGLDIIGIFHSHPDCPNVPSVFDRDWALPWYSYTISRVDAGKAVSIRSFRLTDDREQFDEEELTE